MLSHMNNSQEGNVKLQSINQTDLTSALRMFNPFYKPGDLSRLHTA